MPLASHFHTNSNENTQEQGQRSRLAALKADILKSHGIVLPDVPGRNTQDQESATPNLPENQVSFFILLEADAQNLRLG